MGIIQYSIILVDLNRNIGSEIRKTGPCVVLSPDEMNKYLQTVVVAPMTARSRSCPTRISVIHNKKSGWIVLDQVMTIDRNRMIKKLGTLSDTEISKLKAVLKETYVD